LSCIGPDAISQWFLGGCADYLHPFIWSRVCGDFAMDPFFKFYINLGKSATETLAILGQVFGEESMSCEAVEEQSQKHAHNFL
jgi:hypothetical protein